MTLGYDDSGWTNGPAELGYGDGTEATVVSFGPDSANKYITTYFRHAFTVIDPSTHHTLQMRVLRDDGAVVYLNGHELGRFNMPTPDPINYLTRASSTVSGSNETNFFQTVIPAASNLLVVGTNLVAVEVHQISGTSSDISFDMELISLTTPPPPTVLRGPYLQNATPTSGVIRWRTDLPTDSWIYHGEAPDNLTVTTQVAGARIDHEVMLTNLASGTVRYYAIGDHTAIFEGNDTNHFFKTPPLPGTKQTTRIWVVGDSGTASKSARNVRDAFYAWHGSATPDIFLMLGDNAYGDGTDAQYQNAVFNIYPNTLKNTFLWSTLGNHDGHTADSASLTGPYYDIFTLPDQGEAGGVPSFTEAYYSFDYANIHFLCLNSYDIDRSTNGSMYTWAAADLASTTQDWIIAFWHHPPYSKGSHDSDAETRLQQMRTNFLPLLEDAGVDLVLCGHSHSYERSIFVHGHYDISTTLEPSMKIDEGSGRETDTGAYDKTTSQAAVYVVPGSSGRTSGGPLNHPVMYISTNKLGSLVVDVSSNRLDATFLGETPIVLDWFSIVKEPTFQVEVLIEGQGTVTPGSGVYKALRTLELHAQAEPYYSFTDWTGDVSSVSTNISIVLDTNKSVTARFDALLVTNEVPQWWLAQYGLTPSDTAALQDADGDGVTTWKEYIADTIPTDSNSVFRFTETRHIGTHELVFDASTQRMFTVEQTINPTSNIWAPLSDYSSFFGTGTHHVVTDTNSTAKTKLYRIEVEVP